MNSPAIEFVPVHTWPNFYDVRSSSEVIRFRVLERSKFILLDGDWFRTRWELAPSARDTIFSRCEGRAFRCGGGVTFLVIHASPESVVEMKDFLVRILSDPASWLHWNRDRLRFVPLQVLEAAA